jgi:aminoglycoside phosphotransferase (APT) family kinase protein
MPGIPPAPTPEQFEQVAKAIDPTARVASTRKLVGGISCRMDVVEIQLADDTLRKVVTRQYWELDSSEASNRTYPESAVMRALAANNVPAPEAVIDEQATSKIFDRQAIVISYLDGTPNLTPADPHDWARQLAVAIAQVHSTPLDSQLRPALDSLHQNLTKWMTLPEPPERFTKHPLGTDLWHAMRKMWPSIDTSAEHLLHGDYWPGNTIWDGEELLAIVDWENGGIGEPTLDVGYFLADAGYFGIDIEDTFLEAYEQASDRPIQDLLFWKMVAAGRAMPDVGPWAQGYSELGIRKMTPDEIRVAHSDYVQKLLDM